MTNRPVSNRSNIYKWLSVCMAIIVVCSLISWAMVTGLAAPKSDYTDNIKRLDDSVSHIKDSVTGLDRLQTTQTNDNLNRFDDIDLAVSDVTDRIGQAETGVGDLKSQADNLNITVTGINSTVNSVKTDVDTLKAKRNGAISVIPSYTDNSTITLSITTDTSQTVAFELEFRPTTEIQLTDTTLDAVLKTLYTASPQLVTLSAGSTSIRGDYNIYWKGNTTNKYYLRNITFITPRTSLIAGTQTKTLNYTDVGAYEIIVSPIYITGASTGSW
jgi:hypothetical protein